MIKEHWRKDGTKVHIEPWVIPIMKELLEEHNPALIVEFGPYYGGLTKYLTEWFPNIPIFAIDAFWLVSKKDAQYFRKNNVTFMITTQLCEQDLLIPTLLSLPVKKFLFCDAAFRDQEIREYSGYLRPGDLLGTHDWPDYEKKLEGAFNEFIPHEVNKILEIPGNSECRFWTKRFPKGLIQTPNDDDDLWKPEKENGNE